MNDKTATEYVVFVGLETPAKRKRLKSIKKEEPKKEEQKEKQIKEEEVKEEIKKEQPKKEEVGEELKIEEKKNEEVKEKEKDTEEVKSNKPIKGKVKKSEKKQRASYGLITVEVSHEASCLDFSFEVEKNNQTLCSADGATFRVLKPFLVSVLAKNLEKIQDCSSFSKHKILFTFSNNQMLYLTVSDLMTNQKQNHHELKKRIMDWISTHTFFRGTRKKVSKRLTGVTLCLTLETSQTLATKGIPFGAKLENTYRLKGGS